MSFAQKIATKAAQVGVKTYELCESSTGYLWKYFVYVENDKATETDRTGYRFNDDATMERPDDNFTVRPDKIVSMRINCN